MHGQTQIKWNSYLGAVPWNPCIFWKIRNETFDNSMPSVIHLLAYCCDHGYNELVRTAVEVVMVWFMFLWYSFSEMVRNWQISSMHNLILLIIDLAYERHILQTILFVRVLNWALCHNDTWHCMLVGGQLHTDTSLPPVERVLTAKDLSLLRCDGALLGKWFLMILRVIVLLTSRVKQSSNTS